MYTEVIYIYFIWVQYFEVLTAYLALLKHSLSAIIK